MVCRAGQACLVGIKFLIPVEGDTTDTLYLLHESSCGKDVHNDIAQRYDLPPNSFKLYLQLSSRLIDLSVMKDKPMSKIDEDLSFEQESNEANDTLIVASLNAFIMHKESGKTMLIDDKKTILEPPTRSSAFVEDNDTSKSFMKSETNYVGLVNQAMTCYLNSLIQALYMTPEFRNALYNWEYISDPNKDEAMSLPYQLQRLFLNLQTSSKSAVETTSLTKSFGWESTEAWQQHDIQELCRVMFDALEKKFKDTEQADLINRLYQGKMIDYVKCLECGTEKSREDAFLDIPLPVRPFGSTVAYNSVEEALSAFVQYETLEGNNQYHCDNCNKKCDARKGLKFTKFPYLLTLHLKRFDFDSKTLRRIKLNDKVTFPDTLNLNPFIASTTNEESPAVEEDIGLSVKCDDSSTTDSGTLDGDCPPCENNHTNSNHLTNHDQDDDEGIDMSNGPSTSNCTLHNHENEKNRANGSAKGPYQYELFSIMIHSGSASGGHYYAYVKDFRTEDWFCFNDQSVTQITYEDIQKTYGGGRTRVYYSGSYSSSTNAYMLMYRQIDPARNALPMQTQDFPEHINELLKKMKETEDNDRKNRQKSMITITIYCRDLSDGIMSCKKFYPSPNETWADLTEEAYKQFGLNHVMSLDQCRLVSYDHTSDLIVRSYEGKEHEKFANLWRSRYRHSLLLEVRRKDEKFETYLAGGLATKVYIVDILKDEIVHGPINVRALSTQTVKEYKQMLGKIINMDPKDMKLVIRQKDLMGSTIELDPKEMTLVLRKVPNNSTLVDNDDIQLPCAGFYNTAGIVVSTMLDTDPSKPFHESKLCEIIENLDSYMSLQVRLPDTNKEPLEEMNIPALEEKCKDPEKPIDNSSSTLNVDESQREIGPQCNDIPKVDKNNDEAPARNISPQLGEGEEWNTPEQSNSEDSSLSDSDKTLVGDAPEDDVFQLTFIPASTPNDRSIKMLHPIGLENWDVDDNSEYYSKGTDLYSKRKLLNVLVHKRMKLSTFKKSLEPFVGVPVDSFTIIRCLNDSLEFEYNHLEEPLGFEDGDKLTVKLGRALRTGEVKVKLYQFLMDSLEPYKFLYEWIASKDMTVGQAKKEILAEIKKRHNIDIPYERCRLRKKFFRMVSKIFLDDQKFEDCALSQKFEMLVQELPDKEPLTDSDHIAPYVRRWSPAKMQLGPFQEIIIDGKTIDKLKEKLSSLSDIPEEYIDIAKVRGYFPFDIPVLRVQNLGWNDYMVMNNIQDGSVFIYRDSRETEKPLSPEEITELSMTEMPLLVHSYASNYNKRKERALRIHTDAK